MPRQKKENAIKIDSIFQDEMIRILSSMTEPTWVSFKDTKLIASQLLGCSQNNAHFVELQQELVFGNPNTHELELNNPMELLSFKNFLKKYNFKIINVCYSEDQEYIYVLIDPSNVSRDIEVATMSNTGLPVETEEFYKGKFVKNRKNIGNFPTPRVLNIGSGGDEKRQLPHAINLDFGIVGKPDVVADARHLPFKQGVFSVVMASHILEHIPIAQLDEILKEWIRVLHHKGILRIAVPDAETTLRELVTGCTSKGADSYQIPGGSAPLTQLIGLGGEHSKTDARWRHQILFTFKLLVEYLSTNGLGIVREYNKEEALSLLSGIKLDECNRYSLRVESQRKKQPQRIHEEITYEDYCGLKEAFLSDKDNLSSSQISIIVPVRNEEIRLPMFLSALFEAINELKDFNVNVEVIFSINDTTDSSSTIISNYLIENGIDNSKIIESPKGILNAFVSGINNRGFNGKILKVDVDSFFVRQSFSLLFMNMSANSNLKVTYAESKSSENYPTGLNAAAYYQDFRNERLYFHGRMSLYRENPFDHFPVEEILNSGVAVEDMILSCMYIYYLGIDSIGITPGLFVRSDHAISFDKMSLNWERSRREMKLIEKAFPHLNILRSILKRNITDSEDIPGLEEDPIKKLYHLYARHFHEAMAVLAKINFPNILFEGDNDKIIGQNNWDSMR